MCSLIIVMRYMIVCGCEGMVVGNLKCGEGVCCGFGEDVGRGGGAPGASWERLVKWCIQEERVVRVFLGGGVRGRGARGVLGVVRWWRKRECSREGVRLRIAVCVRHR